MKKNILKSLDFKDKRGIISDIIYNKNFNHCVYILSKKNAVRGNHYHKVTNQLNLILSGKILYFSKLKHKKLKKKTLKKGDLILSKKNEIHAFKCISNKSEMLVFSSGLRGGRDYEKDTFRVDPISK